MPATNVPGNTDNPGVCDHCKQFVGITDTGACGGCGIQRRVVPESLLGKSALEVERAYLQQSLAAVLAVVRGTSTDDKDAVLARADAVLAKGADAGPS